MGGGRRKRRRARCREANPDDGAAVEIAGNRILQIAQCERIVRILVTEEIEQCLEDDRPCLGRRPDFGAGLPMVGRGGDGQRLRQHCVRIGGDDPWQTEMQQIMKPPEFALRDFTVIGESADAAA